MQNPLHRKSIAAMSMTTRLTAVTLAGLVGLSVISVSTNAGLDAIAFNTTPQVINSGTVSITLANGDGGSNSQGFGQTFDKMLPGDTRTVYVRLTNGTTDVKDLELSLAESPSSDTRLTRDAAQGLKVSVTSCETALAAAACTPSTSRLTNLAFNSINTTNGGAATSLISGAISANTVQYLKFDVVLPDINEVTTNGVTPAGTIQGLATNVVWKFKVAQRAATQTTN
jgi:hypothetical protein